MPCRRAIDVTLAGNIESVLILFYSSAEKGESERKNGSSAAVSYNFLKSLSKALRASSALRGAGGPPPLFRDGGGGVLAVPSRATVTRGAKSVHSLALSL